MYSNRFYRKFVILALASGLAAAAPAPVVELAQAQAASQESVKALEERLAKLEEQLQSKGLLALYNEIESLKSEVARLKGAREELEHQLALADKRQKDFYVDLDGRLKQLAETKAASAPTSNSAASAASPMPEGGGAAEGETQAYQNAFAAIRAGNYQVAIKDFQGFIKTFPGSSLAGNAQYWIGFSQFSLGDYKATVESHQKLVQVYPDSPKVPDAMLGLARAQLQLGDAKSAQATLEKIIGQHAGSKAAENAQKLLSTLK